MKKESSTTSTTSRRFSAPVKTLLTLRRMEPWMPEWFDYASIGIEKEHIPQLLRLLDTSFVIRYYNKTGRSEFVVHACRALAELHAVDALPHMDRLLRELFAADVNVPRDILDDLDDETIVATLGADAVPFLIEHLRTCEQDDYCTRTWLGALTEIASSCGPERGGIVSAVRHFLERTLRLGWGPDAADAVECLIQVDAADSVELIDHAVARRPDLSSTIFGNWTEVRARIISGGDPRAPDGTGEHERRTSALFADAFAKRYSPEVGAFFTLRTVPPMFGRYGQSGIRREHIPELLRIIHPTMVRIIQSCAPDSAAIRHATCALAELRDPAAVEPVLTLSDEFSRPDHTLWLSIFREPAQALWPFGEALLHPVLSRISDSTIDLSRHRLYATTLVVLAHQFPQHRGEIVAELVLGGCGLRSQVRTVVASALIALVDLGDVSLLPFLRRAVNGFFAGSLAGCSWKKIEGRVRDGMHPWAPRAARRTPSWHRSPY